MWNPSSGRNQTEMFRVLRRLCLTALLLSVPAHAGSRKHWGEGLAVDMDQPYDQVVTVVREVAEDGIIRGTAQYRGAKELDGAAPANASNSFARWTEGGTVLYKVRPHTLAPINFYESNDEGTVTVRYVVQPQGSGARLRIDAVFEEDSRHRPHPSNGQVENSEYAAISARLDELKKEELKRREELARQEQQKKLEDLQVELDKENAGLEAANTKEQQLQKQLQELQGVRAMQVRTTSADLKAAPYNGSRTLQMLSQGDTVTVLLKTPNWFHVLVANGTEGWVYRLMLEAP